MLRTQHFCVDCGKRQVNNFIQVFGIGHNSWTGAVFLPYGELAQPGVSSP